MRVSFCPQRRDDTLTVSRDGDVLVINGVLEDLSGIPDGATVPAEAIDNEWIVGPIERIDGELHVTLVLPNSSALEPWQAFPEPMTITENGPIDIPCDTTITVARHTVEGGTNIVTTTKRWRQEPEVKTVFVPDPPPPPAEATEQQEADDAD